MLLLPHNPDNTGRIFHATDKAGKNLPDEAHENIGKQSQEELQEN